MKRPAATENTLKRIAEWRRQCPDLTLRSTFIVGFPGETEADFRELLDFLDAAQLDRVGCFQYSPVAGAGANALPDHVPDELKQERYERFMARQQAISAQRLQAKVGSHIPVLIDTVDAEGMVGRSSADAPEIDGNVFLPASEGVKPSDIVTVNVTDADEYDLYGELIP